MNQGQDTPTCVFCSEPAIDGIKTGSGKYWDDVNEPIFQKFLPGRLHREIVAVSKGAVVFLGCAGGKGAAKARAAAAAAAREPKSWPALFGRRKTYVFFGKLRGGLAVASAFCRKSLGFSPVIRDREVSKDCVITRHPSLPVASSEAWETAGVASASRFLHDGVQMKPGLHPQPGKLAVSTLLGCSNKTSECRTLCGAYLCKAGPKDTACPGEDCDELIRDDEGNLLPHGMCYWGGRGGPNPRPAPSGGRAFR